MSIPLVPPRLPDSYSVFRVSSMKTLWQLVSARSLRVFLPRAQRASNTLHSYTEPLPLVRGPAGFTYRRDGRVRLAALGVWGLAPMKRELRSSPSQACRHDVLRLGGVQEVYSTRGPELRKRQKKHAAVRHMCQHLSLQSHHRARRQPRHQTCRRPRRHHRLRRRRHHFGSKTGSGG